MSGQRGASTRPKQSELIVQQRDDPLQPVHAYPAGRQLQRQRDAIQSATELCDDRGALVVQLERVPASAGLSGEELYRWVRESLSCRECHRIRWRAVERGEMKNPFA